MQVKAAIRMAGLLKAKKGRTRLPKIGSEAHPFTIAIGNYT